MDNKGKMNVGPGDMAPLFKCTSVTSKHEENKEFSLEDNCQIIAISQCSA